MLVLTSNYSSDRANNNEHPFPTTQAPHTREFAVDWGRDQALKCRTYHVGRIKNADPRTKFLSLVKRGEDV